MKSANNVHSPRISNDIFPHMNPILILYHITLKKLDRSFFSSIFQSTVSYSVITREASSCHSRVLTQKPTTEQCAKSERHPSTQS